MASAAAHLSLEFKPGDIIQDYCKPFMKILYSDQKGYRCDFCFQPGASLRRCTSCRQVFYCSKPCQVSDWKLAHKVECALTSFRHRTDICHSSLFTPATIDFKFRLLRLFAILKLQPHLAQKQFPLYDGRTRCFDDLMSHHDHLGQILEFRNYCSEIVSNLLAEESLGLNASDTEPLLQYFLKLGGIFKTNAFCIYTADKTEKIGAGLYIQTSVFDHSCKPTAFFLMTRNGSEIQIRAIGPIPAGEKPLISYTLAHKGRADRQRFLLERYNFTCQCQRCDTEALNGETVNPERLQQLLDSSAAIDETSSWTYVLKVHRELIVAFRSIYWEYDERITNQLHWTYTKLLEIWSKGGCTVPPETLDDLCLETRDHLVVTYGPEHEYYKQFQELVPTY